MTDNPCERVSVQAEEGMWLPYCNHHRIPWPDTDRGDIECPYVLMTRACTDCDEEPCIEHVLL